MSWWCQTKSKKSPWNPDQPPLYEDPSVCESLVGRGQNGPRDHIFPKSTGHEGLHWRKHQTKGSKPGGISSKVSDSDRRVSREQCEKQSCAKRDQIFCWLMSNVWYAPWSKHCIWFMAIRPKIGILLMGMQIRINGWIFWLPSPSMGNQTMFWPWHIWLYSDQQKNAFLCTEGTFSRAGIKFRPHIFWDINTFGSYDGYGQVTWDWWSLVIHLVLGIHKGYINPNEWIENHPSITIGIQPIWRPWHMLSRHRFTLLGFFGSWLLRPPGNNMNVMLEQHPKFRGNMNHVWNQRGLGELPMKPVRCDLQSFTPTVVHWFKQTKHSYVIYCNMI